MKNNSVCLEESEVVRLILQFLNSRRFHKTMRNLERESGVTNCSFTEDVIFLRQLILDGEWDAILTFAKPLENIEDFDMKKFRYLVLKEKFMEVLYFKSGVEGISSSYSIEDLVKCLNQLEKDCPFKSDYTKLCWLLTVPDLHEQPEYKDWNPETARLKCFREILELLKNVMPIQKKNGSNKLPKHPAKDRLITLIIKGLCFESCVDYCHQRAVNGEVDDDLLSVTKDVLGGTSHESTGNFLSWLRSLPQESFLAPFEPMSLDVQFKKTENARKFHLSNKKLQREAESLSKSLSLSARPSTADNACRPTSPTNDMSTISKVAELNGRSQSALASVNKVSRSYSDFHYKGESAQVHDHTGTQDQVKHIQNGAHHEDYPGKNTHGEIYTRDTVKSNLIHKDTSNTAHMINDDKINGTVVSVEPSVKLNMAEKVPGVADSQDSIDRQKSNQESNVLKRLEEHEQRQMELRRQLMNDKNSSGLSNGTETKLNGQHGSREHQGMNGYESVGYTNYVNRDEAPKNFEAKNEHLEAQKLTKTRNSNSPSKGNVSDSNEKMCRESPVGKEVSPSYKEDFSIEAPSHYAITSTPMTKKKLKPEPLSFDTINHEAASHLEPKDGLLQKYKEEEQKEEESPREDQQQPVNQYPKTPKANTLPPGHWIALKDGSGVMNTSTPKSCREKMSNTPGPPASPVCIEKTQDVVDNNGHALAGAGEEDRLPDYDDNDDADAAAKVLQHENQENQAVVSDDNPPVRRGPKINGVRRTLVSTGPPMSQNKSSVMPPEERREAKTPRQEKPALKSVNQDLKGRSKAINSPRDQKTINQKQVPVRKISKEEMGSTKRKNSGTTFVVDKGAPGTTSNLTYRKPTNQAQPSNIHEPKSSETIKLIERQQDHLNSTSEPIRFCNVASLEDVQAIRAVAFHPSGELFAIGSNSKTLRVCSASGLNSYKKMESGSDLIAPQPTILFKRNRHHKGSIYCVAWNNSGDVIATGSNDKSIKLLHFDAENCTQIGPEMEIAIHGGTVRDLAFASRSGGSNVLVSGGAGNGNILISDSSTGNTIGQLTGHSGHIMSVFAAKDDIIASGSNDNTVRLWDLRSQRCIDVIATGDSCVASVCVNPTCGLLASGHEDGGCMIYDITAGRTLQFFKPHTLDCRSVRFSPDGHYLITGSYDTSIILLDMQHNLECNIPPYSVVAEHKDKVIQCRWHPYFMAFVSSSADKTACLWTLDC